MYESQIEQVEKRETDQLIIRDITSVRHPVNVSLGRDEKRVNMDLKRVDRECVGDSELFETLMLESGPFL